MKQVHGIKHLWFNCLNQWITVCKYAENNNGEKCQIIWKMLQRVSKIRVFLFHLLLYFRIYMELELQDLKNYCKINTVNPHITPKLHC